MGMQKARRRRSATLVTTRNMKLHMIDEIENRRAAEKFIERFGNDAAREAKIRAAELRAAGDAEGHKKLVGPPRRNRVSAEGNGGRPHQAMKATAAAAPSLLRLGKAAPG